MLVVVQNGEIVSSAEDNPSGLKFLKDRYPNSKIVKSEIEFTPSAMKQLARYYNGRIVPKPTVIISISKDKVRPDGEDEIEIHLKVHDLQPGEKINLITLDIDGARVPVEIKEGEGSVIISTETPGFHIVKVESPKWIHSLKAGFKAI